MVGWMMMMMMVLFSKKVGPVAKAGGKSCRHIFSIFATKKDCLINLPPTKLDLSLFIVQTEQFFFE